MERTVPAKPLTGSGNTKRKRKMDRKLTFQELLQRSAFAEDGITAHFDKNWHAVLQHGDGQDEDKPVGRILADRKPADGYFLASPQRPCPMRFAIERAILDNAEKIENWMYSDEKELKLSFDPEEGLDETVGIGVAVLPDPVTGRKRLVEKECKDVEMILTKTEPWKGYEFAGFGFGIAMKTIYPNAKAPTSVPTNRDLVPDVLSSAAFAKSRDAKQKKEWLRMAGCQNPDKTLCQIENPEPTAENRSVRKRVLPKTGMPKSSAMPKVDRAKTEPASPKTDYTALVCAHAEQLQSTSRTPYPDYC